MGMNRDTGLRLEGFDHLIQSIQDILTTPLGSRVHRRDYGSLLPRLVDRPMSGALVALMINATATALDRWEPRLKLEKVIIDAVNVGGQISMSLIGYYVVNGERVAINGLVI